MGMYMYQAAYSKDAIANLVQNPQNRTDAIKAVRESMGGSMVGCWMAFGEDDIVVIADMPNDEAMAAFCRLIHLTDRGFELQLVPPDMASNALKRGGHYGYQTQITIRFCFQALR